jgi:hypothetical protein
LCGEFGELLCYADCAGDSGTDWGEWDGE